MPKSPDAFRTISEVAEWLEIQAHVLRFWESKFTQVKPIKRAGGRRYYRPNDMLLLGGIKRLLHEDGLTIKGVQKVLREEGMGHVAALSAPLDGVTQDDLDAGGDTIDMTPAPMHEDAEQTHEGVVLPFEQRGSKAAKPAPVEAPETHAETTSKPEVSAEDTPPLPTDEPTLDATEAEPEETTVAPADTSAEDGATLPGFLRHPMTDAPVPPSDNTPDEAPDAAQTRTPDQDAPAPTIDSTPEAAPEDSTAEARNVEMPEINAAPEDPVVASPKPRVIDLPPLTAEEDFPAKPSVLSAALLCRDLPEDSARDIAPLLSRLGELRDSIRADVVRGTKV
ncbi:MULTISPECIES: MerR family transcriptional regulator [Sulfitobacter]|jgi:DNA-binding transcriptional MerR regulator|nr:MULTISPECIES: MerR family transcriptional regulator [Sulfitobacter]QPO07883.1 MerR family transcriptional regulator [Sulfitobacter sp. B30-2]